MRRLADPRTFRQRPRRDRREISLGKRQHLIGGDISGDDEDRVVRSVPSVIEGDSVGCAEISDLVLPADVRIAIRMMKKERGAQLLGQQCGGVVVDP